jgi:hypothetical protein
MNIPGVACIPSIDSVTPVVGVLWLLASLLLMTPGCMLLMSVHKVSLHDSFSVGNSCVLKLNDFYIFIIALAHFLDFIISV